MATGLDQFAAQLKQIEAGLGDFHPKPYYDQRTDSLLYLIRDESSYAKRVTRYFTVHLSNHDDSLVGIEVKGLRTITKVVEDLGEGREVDIVRPLEVKGEDGESLELSVVVRCALVTAPKTVSGKDYDELEKVTRGVRISKSDLCGSR
jgi:hypothetical protein